MQIIRAFAFAMSLLAAPAHAETWARQPIMIGSWGGAYQAAQQKILFEGFANRTGIPVEPVTLTGLSVVREGRTLSGRKLAVADLPGPDAEKACAEGLAEPLDASTVGPGPDGGAPEQDFLAPVGPCGIPATLMAEVVIFDRSALAAKAPARASDLFDVKSFPGKRAMKRDARGTLEWALLADGVEPHLLYPTLGTQPGADRAFAKLEEIRDFVLWWEHGDVPVKALARKDVVMAAAYGARAYQAVIGQQQGFGIVWPGALVTTNRWVLLKGAADPVAAREFIKFATDRERLAELARALPYGPARISALQDLPPEKLSLLASAPEHMAQAVIIDDAFWLKNGEPLRQRFAAWLATPPRQSEAAPPKTQPAPSRQGPAKHG